MEENPTRICELIVGLGEVDVVGVDDEPDALLGVRIRTRRWPACGGCGGGGVVQGDQPGELGGPARVRAPGAPHLAQVALALPGGELSGRLVHRDR